jgi:hypothetical protein
VTGLIVDPRKSIEMEFLPILRSMAWRDNFREIVCSFGKGVRYIQCKMRA